MLPPQGFETARIEEWGSFPLRNEIDFSLAQWNAVGTHEVFTVTGFVKIFLLARILQSLAGGAGATIQLREEGGGVIIPATGFAVLTAPNVWWNNGGVGAVKNEFDGFVDSSYFYRLSNGPDYGFNVAVNPLTAGRIEFYGIWTPLSADGLVVAASGGAL